ncbi:MAG: hypothetical protein CYPHOPRED_000235 [Cyphobasidiales sp. Tagirdzhanova-0007]|nr:MAG: hypothetical protein CYPHOPRED_000235 [Cyphobasidiales sp. Tagirdzhanova-0007]
MASVQQLPWESQRTAQPGAQSQMQIIPLDNMALQKGFEQEQTPDGRPDHINLRGGCQGKVWGHA